MTPHLLKRSVSLVLSFVLAGASAVHAASWNAMDWIDGWYETSTPAFQKQLGVDRVTINCSDLSIRTTPQTCVSWIQANPVPGITQYVPYINPNPTALQQNAILFSSATVGVSAIPEIDIDDFFYSWESWPTTISNAPLFLSQFIDNLKSINHGLKFGITLYEDEVASPSLADPLMPSAIRAKFDVIRLFLHYRANGPNYAYYVNLVQAAFPNAKIVAGVYAYDRIDYTFPCVQNDPLKKACTQAQEINYFQQSLNIQAQLLQQGKVAGLDIYPGYFGNEANLYGPGSNSDNLACTNVTRCVQNSITMRGLIQTAHDNFLAPTLPTISSLSPSSTTAGAAAFTLTVAGSNFISGATIQWNGASRTTTFISGTALSAAIPASDIVSSGTASVTVLNPSGEGPSSAVSFTVTAANNPSPILTSVSTSGIGPTTATIVWTTDKAADTQVVYGLTSAYGSSTTLTTALATSHSVALSGLTAGTVYHYAVKSRDSAGILATSPDAAFTTTANTPPPGCATSAGSIWQNVSLAAQTGSFTAAFDATPGLASMDGVIGLSNGAASVYTAQAAAVRFNNTGKIDARNGGAYAAAASIPYVAGMSYHFRLAVNLPAHTYSAYVTQGSSAEQLIGANYAFRTEQSAVATLNDLGLIASSGSQTVCNVVVTALAASTVISGVSTTGVGQTAATIVWTTNNAADTQVQYGLTSAYGTTTPQNTTLATSHSAALAGLTGGTVYHYQAMSRDAAGTLATSPDATFTTLAPVNTTPPVVSAVAASGVGPTAATIVWTTDKAADSQVVYGLTAAYGLATTLSTALTTSHSVALSGLTAGTAYHYAVKSHDGAGNLATSPDAAFTTTANITPPSCITSAAGSWQNVPLPAQSGLFTAEFDATPSAANMDGVTGLSNGAASAFTSQAVAVRFNNTGKIDARNAGVYAAAIAIPYSAGLSYHFRLVVNMPAHTYSAYVKQGANTEQLIGANYAFRTEQKSAALINDLGTIADTIGSVTDCNAAAHP